MLEINEEIHLFLDPQILDSSQTKLSKYTLQRPVNLWKL